MKPISLLLVLLLLWALQSQAQRGEIDSLLQVLKGHKQDTNRVKTSNMLAYRFFITKPDTAIKLSQEAFLLSRRINYPKGEGMSLNYIGWGHWALGNFPKALELFLQSLKIHEKQNDTVQMAQSNNAIAAVYEEQGNLQQALHYYLKSKSLAFNPAYHANSGRIYRKLKHFDSARVYINQALEWVYQRKNPRNLGWFLSEMGDLYGDAGEYPLALTYFRTSNVQSTLADDFLGLSRHYIGMAKVFEKTGELDSSFYYTKKALEFAQQNNMTKRSLDASSYLATLFQKQYNADSALHYMVLAKVMNDSLFSQQNQLQLQSLTFNEKVREQEKEEAEQKAKEERANNLQYAAIAFGLVTLLIGFLVLSHTVIAGEKLIKFLGIVSLLIVFEFLNLLLHPWIGGLTHHSPVWMLLIMVCVAALLVPMHHKLEHWLIHRLVEKNSKIRVASARKTIQKLKAKTSTVPVVKGTGA